MVRQPVAHADACCVPHCRREVGVLEQAVLCVEEDAGISEGKMWREGVEGKEPRRREGGRELMYWRRGWYVSFRAMSWLARANS